MSTCRSCKAPVRWVKTIGGKKHPLDARPTPEGEWVVQPSVMGEVMLRATPMNGGEERFTSHFATCKHADQHRKRGAA